MGLTNVQLLLSVNFLHFVSIGLVTPALTYHITSNGGNHVVLGVLISALFACKKISKDFVILFERGKRSTIVFTLFSSFLTYLILVFEHRCWMICLNRCVFELTNQVLPYSKEYVLCTQPEDTRVKILNIMEVTKVAGTVLGFIGGGYVFEFAGGFSSVAMVTSILTFSGIILLQYVEDENVKIPKRGTNLKKLPTQCYHQIKNLPKVKYGEKWDCVLLKTLFTLTFAIFFSRFAFLLNFNYKIGFIIIGYSVAYQNMLKFASDCFAPFVKERIKNGKFLFQYSLLICGCSLSGLYYSPSYECYLIVFVPMIFSYTLINLFFEDDILGLRSRKDTREAVETLENLTSVLVPVCFGILCQVLGGQAFKVLVILQIAVCVYLVNQNVFALKKEKEEDKTKED